MNAIHKAAFAVSALAITIVGAALATAPMAFARSVPLVAHGDCATSSLQLTLSGHVDCRDASRDARLIALNRR
ncbi:MAG TPA: hypothetical protein VFX20_16575 [Steroidobacteraceae bacterium]|nr:hypothetical protein [Steroidobacteraceae bacterium]